VRRITLIIPAAGSGSRMKAEVPKPFLMLGKQPILFHTLKRFGKIEGLVQVIVAVDNRYQSNAEEILNSIFETTEVSYQVVEGGKERQYSILNALKKVDNSDLVAVHDAVRPFVKTSEIEKCCKTAVKTGGAVLGIKVRDTIKEVNKDDTILKTPDRSRFWQAQTPQVFQTALIKKAYEAAVKENVNATDDAALVERIGAKVKMVEGSASNIKITFPEDLILATHILKKWE